MKYSVIGNNALIADELNPEWWWVGDDNKDRYEISDKDMKVDLTGYIENPKYVGDYVKHDQLFRAYPEIKDYRVEIRDLIDGLAYRHGAVNNKNKTVYIKRGLDNESAKEAFLHEMQHIVQYIEGFVGGTNKDSAGRALFNKVYNDIKNDPEFKALKTAESKRSFVVHEIERRFGEYLDANGLELKPGFERNFETAAMFAYWNYYGEIEARNTADKDRREMTEAQLAQNRAENNGDIYDKEIEKAKFIDNLIEIGYTESEAKKFIRFGVDSYDNQYTNAGKPNMQRSTEAFSKAREGMGKDGQDDGAWSDGSGRGIHGGRGVRGADTGAVGVGRGASNLRLNTDSEGEAIKITEGDTLYELIFHQRRDVDKRSNAFQYRRNARYGSDRSAVRTDGSSGEERIGEDGTVSGKSDMGAAYSESNRESTEIRDLQSNELSLEKVLFGESKEVGSRTTETLAPVENSALKFSSATKEASSEDGVFFDGKTRHSLSDVDSDLGPVGNENAFRAETKSHENGTKFSLSEQKTPTYEELVSKKPTRIVKITEGIESGSYAEMKAAALRKAKHEGWFDAPHHNNDTDSFIFLTEKSFSHAYSNLSAKFGEDTIRVMAHIPDIIKNAVLIHVADPKNAQKRETKVYTFFGAVEGTNGVEPVKLTVKEYDFKSLNDVPKNIRSYFEQNGIEEKYSSLYDARAFEVIEIEEIKKESDASGKVNEKNPQARATSDSTISIADLLQLVNGDEKKYIPPKTTNSDKLSLSAENTDLGPIGDYNVYGKDVALKDVLTDDYAPIAETPNSQTFEDAFRAETKNAAQEGGVKYSVSDDDGQLDKYSPKQYNDFGWARHAEAISKNELDDLYSKIQEKGSLKKFMQSGYGEAIIEVNDDPHSTLGVNNVFVFVTGTKNNPIINKVVRFDIETETEMEVIKEQLYERRTFSYTYYSFLREKGLAREYRKKSAVNYNEYSQKVRSGSSRGDSNGTYGNGGFERDGRGTLGETLSDEIAPIKEASSEYGVFFDGETRHSLSEIDNDLGPVGNDNAFEDAFRAETKNTAQEGGVKYSMSNGDGLLDKYSQKQYNDFGWARHAEAISKNELDDMYSKVQEKGSLKNFPQSGYGEAIIEVNDKPHTTLGANNVLVFVTGTRNNPKISRVVRIALYDENLIDIFRKEIYENSGYRALEAYAHRMGEELLRYYDRRNYPDYRAYKDKSGTRRSGSDIEEDTLVNRIGDQRSGASKEAESDLIAPIKEASSEDGVFFDGKSHFSLANAVDAPVGQGTPLKDIRVNALPDDFAPIGETPNSQTSVDSESKKIINKLTGREIAPNTYMVLDRLSKGENVSSEEISNLKEVREGILKTDELRQSFVANHPELNDVPSSEVGTYLLNDNGRIQLRNEIINKRLNEGSFTSIDENGNEVYNGEVEKNRRLDIVIGLPASGKSSSIVNPLSQFYHSAVIDSDIIKRELPEYNDGWGASLVHEESTLINTYLLGQSMDLGNNIVLPVVGSKVGSVKKYIELAKEHGYKINIHLNELSNGKATGRVLQRYFDTGRFINPAITAECGNTPTEVYEQIKQRGDISGYSRWNNDVPKGQRPALTEISGNNRLYASYSGTWGSGGRSDIGRTDSKGTSRKTEKNNEIAPFEKASSEDGVFFDGENIADDLGPIAQDPVVQEPTETESDAKTENSNLSVRELYEQKLSNHKNALAALETDKSNSLSSFDEAIRKKLEEYNDLKDKNTKRANTLLQQIDNLRLRRDNVQADYANRIAKQQARIEAFESKSFEEFENETLAAELDNVRVFLIGNIVYNYVFFRYSVLTVYRNDYPHPVL